MSNDLVIRESTALSVDAVLDRLHSIQELMRRAMDQGVDYGSIPGTNSKPTLLKPGAEKLGTMFRLSARYKTSKVFHPDGHLTVDCTCQVVDRDEFPWGEAAAMCSTRESKYAFRKAERLCPECGAAAVIKGKVEYGGGWLCWQKRGGCGWKFEDGDAGIMEQKTGTVTNEHLADSYNTVLRIAEKRAYIAAMRLATGSSALFDEEGPGHGEDNEEERAPQPPKKSPAKNGEPQRAEPDWSAIEDAGNKILRTATTQEELKLAWGSLSKDQQRVCQKEKDRLKETLAKTAPPPPACTPAPGETLLAHWIQLLAMAAGDRRCVNALIVDDFIKIKGAAERSEIWTLIQNHGRAQGWEWDRDSMSFTKPA